MLGAALFLYAQVVYICLYWIEIVMSSNSIFDYLMLPQSKQHWFYGLIKLIYKTYVWFMSFGQGVECQNCCWISNICYCYLVWLRSRFTIWGTFKVLLGCINSKEIICSNLYYFQKWLCFQIWFSCRLKKWKQTINNKTSFDPLSKWHETDINYLVNLVN